MLKKRVLVAVLAALAILGGWIALTRPEAPPARAAATSPAALPASPSSSSRPETAANPPAGAVQADLAPTPLPRSIPERYRALKAQASAGDTSAACRLALALHHCQQMPLQQKALLEMRRQAYEMEERSPQRTRLEAAIETRVAQIEGTQAACQGLDPIETRDAWRYLLQAANAGHLPSMLRFVHGFGLNWNGRPLDDLDQWTAYRDNMPAILERLVATGRPEAYTSAAKLYRTGPFGQSPVGRDPVKSLALTMALVRATAAGQERAIQEVQISRMISEEGLDPAAVARAEAMAAPLAAKLDFTRPKVSVAEGDCDETRNSPPR